MREAIGGTWIFGIVVTFIVLFSSYLAISVNYSKAFHVKNEVVNIIEKYEGYNEASKEAIEKHMNSYGYSVRGSCSSGFNRGQGQDGSNGKYKYCIKCSTTKDSSNKLNKTYYTVTVFFRLDLPVIGDIFTFPVSGETKSIHFSNDSHGLKCDSI
ncbi:MAG: hypothetical protein PHX04_02560 [Bacilli bacterium]|nr:hypothetical protein [Bacilli bacterium]